jgi:hypothetical protein
LIIYDCEIVKCIPDRSGYQEPDLEFCEGWHDYAGMGISVIGCYDYEADQYRVFCKDNWRAFIDLAQYHGTLIGFNNISFDNRLLAANGLQLPADRSYDLLVEIWRAAGLGPTFNCRTHGGFGLDAMCAANFGLNKTGRGDLAPIAWQRGRVGEVIDYCLNDVALTKKLVDKILTDQTLISPKDGRVLSIRMPDYKV